jgi:hypothetical protein
VSNDWLLVGGSIAQTLGNLYFLYRLRILRNDLESLRRVVGGTRT